MGNCFSDDLTPRKSSRSESYINDVSYSDRRRRTPSLGSGEYPVQYHQGPFPGTGYVQMGPRGYVNHAPMLRYPGDPMGGYYQPRGPMLIVDPYTGMTYDYGDRMYDPYTMDTEQRHGRRQGKRTSSTRHDDDDDDDDNHRSHRHRRNRHDQHRDSRQKLTENGMPLTKPASQMSSVDEQVASTDVKTHPNPTTSSKTVTSPVAVPSAAPGITSPQTERMASMMTTPTQRTESDRPLELNKVNPVMTSNEAVTSSSTRQERSASYEPRDVMISYSRSDSGVMEKIKNKLEAAGITVWVDISSIDAGADFLSKIGEAIIDAKLFVCILSEQAVRSRYCRDEVALAYVSNTAIYPVTTQPRDTLLPLMDTGLKLQLANYNWTSLTDKATMSDNVDRLVSAMRAELDDLRAAKQTRTPKPLMPRLSMLPQKPPTAEDDEEEEPVTKPLPLRERNNAMTSSQSDVNGIMPEKFWSDRFGVSDFVMWDRFKHAFLDEFREPVEQTFSTEDRQHLTDILKREMEVADDDKLFKYQYLSFCSSDGKERPVWRCVYDQARESFAMREVFNMDSSVRVDAIENLGKFRSAAVIDALRDLLKDPDANVRAVATVSLSRTDVSDPVTIRHILRMLNDKDRLVREAGCLALGHLKARQAISRLTHIWRNDVISHVREAAAAALRQIGGPEVENEMRVTKVLAEEIRTLTELPA